MERVITFPISGYIMCGGVSARCCHDSKYNIQFTKAIVTTFIPLLHMNLHLYDTRRRMSEITTTYK